jgi:hypothetical protein
LSCHKLVKASTLMSLLSWGKDLQTLMYYGARARDHSMTLRSGVADSTIF